VLVKKGLIAQPATFGQMMPQRTTNRVVANRMSDRLDELCHDPSRWRLLDVLAIRPPAEIVNLLHVLIGTGKKGDASLYPVPRLRVGDQVDDLLRLHRIEVIDVVLEVVGGEKLHCDELWSFFVA